MSPRVLFQSTCLREARQGAQGNQNRDRNFNPRAYVRHDVEVGCVEFHGSDFNPRAYVRHDEGGAYLAESVVFQSTCLREARPMISCRHCAYIISIHVPT